MKITLIVTGLHLGGAERQVCDLADHFAQSGNQVLLISLTGETAIMPNDAEVRVEQLHMQKTTIGFVKGYWRATGLIHDFCPDVVHSHMIHANLFARLLRLSVNIPRLISTAHSTNEGGKFRMLAYRLTDRLTDLSTNVSEDAVMAFIAQGACKTGRMIAMYNGIDTKRFRFDAAVRNVKRDELKLDEGAQLILSVGRLEVVKDYGNLLRAFSILAKYLINVHLAIIGTGKLQNELLTLARQLDIAERVHFLGLQHDVEAWMSAADLFVLSSMWEGFGLVVAEAMACERAVVATDCGGVKEVVGEYGTLVEPMNSEALSLAITKALSKSPSERSGDRKLAREWIEKKYALPVIAKKWISIYQSTPNEPLQM
jgi:glycosyltransferase involved in cell wall biosynthesis